MRRFQAVGNKPILIPCNLAGNSDKILTNFFIFLHNSEKLEPVNRDQALHSCPGRPEAREKRVSWQGKNPTQKQSPDFG
jgi:hypothetical protein